MREDLDNHGGLLDGGNNLQVAATLRQLIIERAKLSLNTDVLTACRAGDIVPESEKEGLNFLTPEKKRRMSNGDSSLCN